MIKHYVNIHSKTDFFFYSIFIILNTFKVFYVIRFVVNSVSMVFCILRKTPGMPGYFALVR